jgi:hypothetical protein
LFVTYFVIFCNFLLFAEDPISHSHTGTWCSMIFIFTWRMVSSGLLRRVALVVTTQKTPFFIVTAVKTSNLTSYLHIVFLQEWRIQGRKLPSLLHTVWGTR